MFNAKLPRYYRRDGTPYLGRNALFNWARDFQNQHEKVVKQARLDNGYFVSTVWLGLDHNYGGGPPLIFETMVFLSDDAKDRERYSTEAQAIAGHATMVKKWAKKKPRNP